MANVFENPSVIVTLIIQVILSLVLIVVVLFQSSNQEGLSGAIAGGANNFFGKNKGRTLDAKLKKLTTVIAILFLISSVLLGVFIQNAAKEAATIDIQQMIDDGSITIDPATVEGETTEGDAVEGEEGADPSATTEETENTATSEEGETTDTPVENGNEE